MNQLLSRFGRRLGFNRPAPKTRAERLRRRAGRLVNLLALFYLGLHAFPQVLFAHQVTVQNITFYSRAPLPAAGVTACALRARALLRRSELAFPERAERVFVCDSPWVFGLFGPLSTRAFAISVPVTDNVFIAEADFPADVTHRAAPDHNRRALSGVVAHEITHGLIRRRLGLLAGVRLPVWVAEGYCDYVAGQGSFPEAEGRRLMAAGESDPSPSFRYYEYRQMVRHLIEEEHLSFAQVVGRAPDLVAVEDETRRAVPRDPASPPLPSHEPD